MTANTTEKPNRNDVRAKIFAAKKNKSKEVEFFGAVIELRQPTLGDILSARDSDNRQSAVIETLVNYAYIPGTDEKVFEMADAEAFKKMPFGADFIRVSNALEELSEVNFLDKKPA
jgi:hypothetical protein